MSHIRTFGPHYMRTNSTSLATRKAVPSMQFSGLIVGNSDGDSLTDRLREVVTDRCMRIATEQIRELAHSNQERQIAAFMTLGALVCGYPPPFRRALAYRLSVLKHAAADPFTKQLMTELIDVIGDSGRQTQRTPTPSAN